MIEVNENLQHESIQTRLYRGKIACNPSIDTAQQGSIQFFKSFFQQTYELWKRGPQRKANRPQLHHVDHAFTAFDFAHVGLSDTESFRQFYLREPAILPKLLQKSDYFGIFLAID